MPVGTIVLVIVSILIYFGVAHRVLDRMRLTDRAALVFIVAMILGGWLNFTVVNRPVQLLVNVGGAVVPLILAFYLIGTADEPIEKWRGIIAAIVTGGAIWGLSKVISPDEQTMSLDPMYTFAIVAGVIAYILGRSRRSAFIAGTLGIILSDIFHFTELSVKGIPGKTWIGGAGAFDAVIISGLIAVLLAEVVGETRERLQGGTSKKDQGGTRQGGGDHA